jgi:hypothetical protein
VNVLRLPEKDALLDQRPSDIDPVGQVDFQDGHGDSPDGSLADEDRSGPGEMPRPFVASGVKKPDHGIRGGIDAGNVRPFVMIASETRQGEIAGSSSSTVFGRNDVIDFVRQGRPGLRQVTVFTPPAGPVPNEL